MAKEFEFKFDEKFFDKLAEKFLELESGLDSKTAKAVGKVTVDLMKDMIKKGISPIRGQGRFQRYKNPKKYPGDRKPKTPVNLKLTGDMLSSLKHKENKRGAAYSTTVLYEDPDQAIKEQGHREGANSQPKRPTIPEGNEEIAKTIEVEIRDLYIEALERHANRIFKKR